MNAADPQHVACRTNLRRFKHWRQTIWICAVVASMLAFYVGSYYYFSRRGVAEAANYGMKGFLYGSSE